MSSYISKNTIEEILEDPDFVIKLASKVKEDKSYIDFVFLKNVCKKVARFLTFFLKCDIIRYKVFWRS